MRLIGSFAALALLKAGSWVLDRADGLRQGYGYDNHTSDLRPVERMLIGVFIAGLWIWISARAGR